jgi:extracellular factor (EF) 3-hydroxypalmitic acid methyl ester biosynthesis protein
VSVAQPMPAQMRPADLAAMLRAKQVEYPTRVVGVYPHTLLVAFEDHRPPVDPIFDGIRLQHGEHTVDLGRCSFVPHDEHPHRRKDDLPPDPGDGRLMFLDHVYDFTTLVRDGVVADVRQSLQQLPLVWQRKEGIRPAFRDYAADLVYDLQAYRLLLDDIDRNLGHEPLAVRARIRQNAVAVVYPEFASFFDGWLRTLENLVAEFTRQEHERHGFYLRKHVWDLILASPFLSRTNLKPRGYAGDSDMMRMIYEDTFRGVTLFSMCMHRHPIRTDAAQAVRNRRQLIADAIHARLQTAPKLRVMSVACGPAAELADVVRTADDAERLEVVLLDQDPDALSEATASAQAVSIQVRRELRAQPIQESVRTMLRAGDLPSKWGRFDFIYTMGLFDYLQAPVARVVLTKLYDLLSPGGELVVGNFHVGNSTRIYLEYWMDWVLLHRSEDDMLALAAELPEASAEISFEATRSQMFLHVRKRA